jgi:hypothetical protein
LFGPTNKANFYKPVRYHNKSSAKNVHKTTWVLKQGGQYEAFRIGDEAEWICKRSNGLFSILDMGNVVLGANEERLSFFPTPVNDNEPYHGFPVESGEYEPSVELVDRWLHDKIIDDRMHIKILRGQI